MEQVLVVLYSADKGHSSSLEAQALESMPLQAPYGLRVISGILGGTSLRAAERDTSPSCGLGMVRDQYASGGRDRMGTHDQDFLGRFDFTGSSASLTALSGALRCSNAIVSSSSSEMSGVSEAFLMASLDLPCSGS